MTRSILLLAAILAPGVTVCAQTPSGGDSWCPAGTAYMRGATRGCYVAPGCYTAARREEYGEFLAGCQQSEESGQVAALYALSDALQGRVTKRLYNRAQDELEHINTARRRLTADGLKTERERLAVFDQAAERKPFTLIKSVDERVAEYERAQRALIRAALGRLRRLLRAAHVEEQLDAIARSYGDEGGE